MPNRVRAFAPCTVANLACGFDVLGLALEQPGDEIEIVLTDTPGVVIRSIAGDNGQLPRDSTRNAAGAAVIALREHLGSTAGFDLHLTKKSPAGSGLGSSAASSAVAAFAANALLGSPLTARELIAFAMEGERTASGSAHADNVAPALLGGITLVRSSSPLDVVELPVPADLRVAVALPRLELKTRDARRILRDTIRLEDAVRQWGNVGAFVAALYRDDYELLARALEDRVAEEARAVLIPGFSAVKSAACAAGALGCSISGAGPSIFSLCRGADRASAVASAKGAAFAEAGVSCEVFVSAINRCGPQLL